MSASTSMVNVVDLQVGYGWVDQKDGKDARFRDNYSDLWRPMATHGSISLFLSHEMKTQACATRPLLQSKAYSLSQLRWRLESARLDSQAHAANESW